ncbi:MAG: hypothetical protein AAFV80_17415 [Bacteroidota bacterium]
MFESLPAQFRESGLDADIRTLILLRKSMEKGLVNTLGDLYLVLKGLVTKRPEDYGPFTAAFYKYFLGVEIKRNESLESAIARSKVFNEWKEQQDDWIDEAERPEISELIDRFLDEVHLSTYDIQKVLDGKEILRNDDPNRPDDDRPNRQPGEGPKDLKQAADYNEVDLKELLERMEKVREQQKRDHQGGNHWIGSNGTSPYGQQGAAFGGVRTGGTGGGKMARMVIGDKNYYPVDRKVKLQDNNIDVALAFLKGIEEETSKKILDTKTTIKEGVKLGGLFLPYEKEKLDKKVQVILLIDNGGYSMTPYVKAITKLFGKLKRRFAHDLKTYYYHNTIYDGAFEDVRRTKFVSIDKLKQNEKKYIVFVIGDADMAPYELSKGSTDDWRALTKHFKRMVWLNPVDLRFWAGSDTINMLRSIVPMFPMTIEGIEKAIHHVNKIKVLA